MTEKELKEYYMIFTDTWKFFRKWAVVNYPMTDKQWTQVKQESEELFEKYGRCELVESLILAAVKKLEDLERQVKK